MAGFGTFLKNYVKGGFSPYSLLSAAFGKSPFGNSGFLGSMLNKYTGAGLTGAEKEANAFSAEQAQKQMDFQQQMRDTQYQSAVSDMRAAGVNPALMYGSGASGNVAPAGASASSIAPANGDFVGLLGQIANLSLLNEQRKNIKADTKQKIANAAKEASETTLNELKANYQNLLNEWYPKLSQNTINQMQSAVAESYSNVTINGYKADNLQANTALQRTQEFVQSLEAEWIPRLRSAQEQGQIASAAQAFAEAAYKKYFKKFAEEHDGVLPGPNQALGIGAAVSGVLSDIGMNEVDLEKLDWIDMMWPWASPFRSKWKK